MAVSLDDLREPTPAATQAQASRPASYSTTAAQANMPTLYGAAQAAADGARAADAGTVSADATGYNAQTGEVDPTTMTAAGQVNEITSQDSPLMRQAAERGQLLAQARGLQDSSFAAGASQREMINAATPLAQQDAATYFQNMRANLEAENRAAEVSTGRETDMSALNAQMEQQVSLQNAREQNQIEQLNAQLETAVNQQNADAINRINSQIMDLEASINTRNAELQTQVNLNNADARNRAALAGSELETQVSLANAGAQNALEQEALRGNQELNRQFLAGTQAQDLAAIQGRYQQLISSNQAAASIYNSYLTSIGQAMANDRVTPGRISQYINVMVQQLEGSLELIDTMNNLNLGNVDLPGTRSSGGTGNNSSITPGIPTPVTSPNPGTPTSPGFPTLPYPYFDEGIASGVGIL